LSRRPFGHYVTEVEDEDRNRNREVWRAVLLDLDDTLCEYRRDGSDLLGVAFETVGADPFFEFGEYCRRYEEHSGAADTVAGVSGVFRRPRRGTRLRPRAGGSHDCKEEAHG
jgi:hypothetical protein